jgi:uncharacterized protein YodC (DUF2158 family)
LGKLERKTFQESDLEKVGDPYPWSDPPGVGDAVELNSGGPRMVIVDTAGGFDMTCAWEYTPRVIRESSFDWRCLKPWEPKS